MGKVQKFSNSIKLWKTLQSHWIISFNLWNPSRHKNWCVYTTSLSWYKNQEWERMSWHQSVIASDILWWGVAHLPQVVKLGSNGRDNVFGIQFCACYVNWCFFYGIMGISCNPKVSIAHIGWPFIKGSLACLLNLVLVDPVQNLINED